MTAEIDRHPTAIVTGAGSGIGLAITRKLLARGARVVACDMNLGALADVQQPELATVAADVTAETTPTSLVEAALDLSPTDTIESLFNCAGVLSLTPSSELARSEWDRVLDVNLTSYFLVTQAVGAAMREARRGAILNIASIAGSHGVPIGLAYSVSKHGVIGLTRSLAMEWAPYGVRVNALSPGFTTSGMTEDFRVAEPARYADRLARVPLGRAGTADEQAEMALFLNSEAAAYATGMTIELDGGGHALYSGYAPARLDV
jgi:NAD(P)-dependent dehydrogenase (short-subunit alcohol dehydrogenase family)